MSETIQITVLCFAGLKEKIGAARVCLSLDAGSTCAQFKEQLITAYPKIQALSSHLLVARDGKYIDDSVVVQHEDELACFPPVSGG